MAEDEELTPTLECQKVADWLESIGRFQFFKFVTQEYSKESETCQIYDHKETLGQKETMSTLLDKMDMHKVETRKLNKFQAN